MNKFILLVFLMSVFTGLTHADKFQLFDISNDDTTYYSYSEVKVFDNAGVQIFNETTDRYGRITIKLPVGEYYADLLQGEEYIQSTVKIKFNMSIDGSNYLKKLYLRKS